MIYLNIMLGMMFGSLILGAFVGVIGEVVIGIARNNAERQDRLITEDFIRNKFDAE